MEIKDKLKSRKFWVAAATFMVLILNPLVGKPLDDETQQKLWQVAVAYIGGEGLVDAARAFVSKG